MRFLAPFFVLIFVGSAQAPAVLGPSGGDFEQRVTAYKRMVSVLYRLSRTAANQCPGESIAGLVLDHPGMYAPRDRPLVGFSDGVPFPRILAVADSSPAADAGLAREDAIRLIGALPAPHPATDGGLAAVEMTIKMIAEQGRDGHLALQVERNGEIRSIALSLDPGCDVWLDLTRSNKVSARSRGSWIQLSEATIALLPKDGELAFVLGHELGHIVLRRRGERAGRDVERRVDDLALGWMREAGYAPQDALTAIEKMADDAPLGTSWGVRTRISHLREEITPR